MKKIDLSKLTTEKRNEKTMNIGSESSINIVKLINNEDQTIAKKIATKKEKIAKLIDSCYSSYINGGRIIYVGAGTSGRLGVLDASEILPTYGVSGKFVGIIAGGEYALINPVEGAEDDEKQAILDLKKIKVSKKDIVIGLTASGRTPYVVSAIKFAKSLGCKTGSISTSKNSEISKEVNTPIEVVVGPEPITGSTRMKSGTAQKMILNMISSGTMIKVGKVYENLMIDVQPSNEKLIVRCQNIIKNITKASDKDVLKVFNESKSVPLSIIMIKKDVSLKKAKEIYSSKNFSWSKIK